MQFHDGDKVKTAKGDETLHGVVCRGMDRAGLIVLRVEWGHGAISSWKIGTDAPEGIEVDS